MEELKVGLLIKDRYVLKQKVGSGGFGEVWLARDHLLGKDVAIKVYISLDETGLNDFKSEYLSTKGLTHPNLLVPEYIDIWGTRPFLIMDYCADGCIASRAGRMTEEDIWKFIRDVSAGLSYLHNLQEPIVHQDIKPDNILIGKGGKCQITDFGISRKMRATLHKQTKIQFANNNCGAIAYMGPEKFHGNSEPVKASDIWALGVSIYELVTGELPFQGMGGQMLLHTDNALPTLEKSKWSSELNNLMRTCLSKDTWNRPTADTIEKLANEYLNPTPKPKPEEPGGGTSRNGEKKPKSKWYYFSSMLLRHKKPLIGLASLSVVAAGIGVYFLKHPSSTEEIHKDPEVALSIHEISIASEDQNGEQTPIREKESPNISAPVSSKYSESVAPKPVSSSVPSAQASIPIESSSVSSMPVKRNGTVNLGYATYTGELKDGCPHGKGRLSFHTSHTDNKRGYEAEVGDYIEGTFTNGHLDAGSVLYKTDGVKKILY